MSASAIARQACSLACIGLIVLAAVACAGDSAPSEPTPLPTGDENDRIEAASLAALQALIYHDADSLNELMSPTLRETTTVEAVQILAACIPPGVQLQPVDGDINAYGEDASAFVYLETVEAEPTQVEFRFDMLREESGRWSLAALPACPF